MKKIKMGDLEIELSKLGLDFYINSKKVCWINNKGVKALKEFLNEKEKRTDK